MIGSSGPGTPDNTSPGYRPPTSGPTGGAHPGNPNAPTPNYPSGLNAPLGAPPAPPPATGRRLRGPREERNPNERYQRLTTVAGVAVGLLLIALGVMLGLTQPIPGLASDATATPNGQLPAGRATTTATGLSPSASASKTALASTTVTTSANATTTPRAQATATATQAATATATPGAILSISPTSVPLTNCKSGTLTTLTLKDPGTAPVHWTSSVDSADASNITLQDGASPPNTITSGDLVPNETSSVNVVAGNASISSQTTITITFDATPSTAGPVTVTITCA